MTTGQDECGMCAPPATSASVLPKPHPHPRYNNKAARLRTFEDWPKSMKQKPEELAEAGFYYTGQSDKTKCFYCDGGLKDWEEDDVPWEQHARWFDRCAYVQLVKGEDYVQKVMSSQKGKVIIAPNKASNSAIDPNYELGRITSHLMDMAEPTLPGGNTEAVTYTAAKRKTNAYLLVKLSTPTT
ncbi:death-associated inhibitor of apoptosis 1-like [Cydia fagiglandana]|uniref:death-associated inhibitor of apoptosis 1-like n=1 Tax=Cydia fagiglandana TaxID=1458189 RepID=UPI002FEE57B9